MSSQGRPTKPVKTSNPHFDGRVIWSADGQRILSDRRNQPPPSSKITLPSQQQKLPPPPTSTTPTSFNRKFKVIGKRK